MKKLIAITLLAALGFLSGVRAQTNTNSVPVISGPVTNLLNFLGSGSNFISAVYGIASTDGDKYGGGVALGYKISDFVVPFLRLDYYDGEVWMPSGSLQLQLPITISGKVRVTPFAFAGIASPISGAEENNLEVRGIFGLGAAVSLSSRFGLIADIEKWTSFEAQQIRFGAFYKF